MTIKVDIIDWATTSEAFRNIIRENKVVVQSGKHLVEQHERKE